MDVEATLPDGVSTASIWGLEILGPAQSCLLTTCQDLPGTISQLMTTPPVRATEQCFVLLGSPHPPEQGCRPSWSTQVTADNGATVGFGQAVEVGAENSNKEQTPRQRPGPHLPPEEGSGAGQGVFRQSKLGHVNLGKSGQLPGRFHRHPPEPDFPVLSLPEALDKYSVALAPGPRSGDMLGQ